MVPAAVVDKTIADMLPLLEAGDTLIDGGNSYYVDDIRRAKELATKGIHYVDVGTSVGVWGLERGYCMMIGGKADVVQRIDPIFTTLAPGIGDIARTPGREKLGGTAELGYPHCGSNGAGHFVKMVHSSIEYGIMAAYAEGFGVLKAACAGKQQNEADAETTPLRDPEHYQYEFNLTHQNRVAAGPTGISDSVPGIRRGFCAESTGMLSYGHSVFLGVSAFMTMCILARSAEEFARFAEGAVV
jgi:6-phosphogluconate dehydrogenase